MKLKNLYEKVNMRQNIDERTFLNFFNESVSELYIMFGVENVTKSSSDKELEKTEAEETEETAIEEYSIYTSLEDENLIYRVFHLPILYNILYLMGLSDSYKSIFLQRSEEAMKKLWTKKFKATSGIMKRGGW